MTVHKNTHRQNTQGCLFQWQLSFSSHPPITLGVFSASIDDLADVVAIYNAAVPSRSVTADLTPVSTAMREKWFFDHLHDPNRPIYVLKRLDDNGLPLPLPLIGWGSFSDLYARPAYHISSEISLYLHPDYHKQGIGRDFLTWMLQKAPSLGIKNVVALIFAHNQPSLALFRQLGLEQWGHMPQVCDMDGFLADVVMLAKQVG